MFNGNQEGVSYNMHDNFGIAFALSKTVKKYQYINFEK